MAYEIKYRVEFASLSNIQWKIDVLEDSFAGSITDLLATGDPLHIEYLSDSDIFNEPVRLSKAIFNVYSFVDFELVDFYTDQDFRLKVNIYKDTLLFWTGWITTGEHGEPYDPVPYPVKITAIDGLSLLKEILYCDSVTVTEGVETIVYYESRMIESRILLDILGKINITGFREYVNIFADEMLFRTINDSPIEQTVIDVDVFRDMYCWDVLIELLQKYNAVLRQKDGEVVIYRPCELCQPTVYGRIFTAWNTKTSTSYIPDQQIERAGITSGLRQFPGSQLMTKRPAKKVTISQDYGYKKSWINNYEFKGNTYIPSPTFKFKEWDYYGGTGVVSINSVIPSESDGLLMLSSGGSPAFNVSQEFGDYAVQTSKLLSFSFDYLLYNPVASQQVNIHIIIKTSNSSHFLYGLSNGVTCAWSTSPTELNIVDTAAQGISDWKTWSRSIPGLPADGPYKIEIYCPSATNGMAVGFKNIVFTSTSDYVITKKVQRVGEDRKKHIGNWKKVVVLYDVREIIEKSYIITNAITGIDLDYEYKLGDVTDTEIDGVIEQFAGSLAVNANEVLPSSAWNTISPGGESRPLLEIIGGEIGLQYSRPRQFIQMEIKDSSVFTYTPNTGYGILYNWRAAKGMI